MDGVEQALNDMTDVINDHITWLERQLEDIEFVVQSAAINQRFLDAQGEIARIRRNAVRRLRQTMTLREIAEATGLAHQRIAQIERGMDRKEK